MSDDAVNWDVDVVSKLRTSPVANTVVWRKSRPTVKRTRAWPGGPMGTIVSSKLIEAGVPKTGWSKETPWKVRLTVTRETLESWELALANR